MIDKVKINDKEYTVKEEGRLRILELPIEIKVADKSFLHIGSTPSPLTEKKGAVFKIDGTPVIPATSFKGALRNQLELLFIEKTNEFMSLLNVQDNNWLKPCIPAPKPTKAELTLLGKYRKHCEIKVEENIIIVGDNSVCPVCYFMGCAGLMGFLRFSNFYPDDEGYIIDQTNIRIDRKTGTAAYGAKVEGEQVKPGTLFKGSIYVVISEPIWEMQGVLFGKAREIENIVIDKWLENWNENDNKKRAEILINKILIPAIQNIKILGGQRSRGGNVECKVDP